jgi:NADH:ubiquinone oxidoreductase subunit 6 (subunit J)
VLILTIWNLLRVWTSLAWSEVLNEFSSQPSSIIITVSGAVWMFAGIFILWSIWYWSERLIWQRPHPNWPFAVIVNLVLLGFILFTIKSLSREAYEQKNENPKSE